MHVLSAAYNPAEPQLQRHIHHVSVCCWCEVECALRNIETMTLHGVLEPRVLDAHAAWSMPQHSMAQHSIAQDDLTKKKFTSCAAAAVTIVQLIVPICCSLCLQTQGLYLIPDLYVDICCSRSHQVACVVAAHLL